MGNPMAGSDNRRRFPRARLRVPCRLRTGPKEPYKAGFLVDVSASGIFVQTATRAEAGTAVEILVDLEDGNAPVQLDTTAVRLKQSHRAVKSVRQGGLALRIDKASERFFEQLLRVFDP